MMASAALPEGALVASLKAMASLEAGRYLGADDDDEAGADSGFVVMGTLVAPTSGAADFSLLPELPIVCFIPVVALRVREGGMRSYKFESKGKYVLL
jgi:hypothetical protein